MTRGRRDFSSVSTVNAEQYDVLAEPNVAEQARRLIGTLGKAGSGPASPIDVGRPRP